jgi:hypothetical protein
VASVAASLIVELIIAAIAHGAGAYSVVGLLIAVVVWELVRRRAGDPVAVMRRLVPIVVVLSWAPDIALGATHREASSQLPHTTWGEVAALMVMHLFVAAIGIGLFSRLLPLRRRPAAPSNLGWQAGSDPQRAQQS